MGRYKPFFILGIAVVIALVFSLLAYTWLQKKGQAKQPVAQETQPIVVAVADLTWGTLLSKEMLETRPVLKDSFPGGGFSDPSALVGRVLSSNIKAGEPFFESRLAPATFKTGGVAAVISPQKRAIAVKVDKTVAVAGFIRPGNRVDVLVSLAGRGDKNLSEPITKIVLENMLVLAVGPDVEPKGKEPSNLDVITLEGTPEETEKLALASVEGKIQIALRNHGDSQIALTRGTTIPALLASYNDGKPVVNKPRVVVAKKTGGNKPVSTAGEKKPGPAAEQKPVSTREEKKPDEPLPFIVELIKGGKVTEVKF